MLLGYSENGILRHPVLRFPDVQNTKAMFAGGILFLLSMGGGDHRYLLPDGRRFNIWNFLLNTAKLPNRIRIDELREFANNRAAR